MKDSDQNTSIQAPSGQLGVCAYLFLVRHEPSASEIRLEIYLEKLDGWSTLLRQENGMVAAALGGLRYKRESARLA